MANFFLCSDLDIRQNSVVERQLKDLFSDLSHVAEIKDLPAPTAQSYVFMLAPHHDSKLFREVLDEATRNRGQLFFILISESITVETYKQLTRSGAAEWVSSRTLSADLNEFFARRRAVADVSGASRTNPVLITLLPSAGGVGNATLAVEISSHLKMLKASKDRKICIVDLDFQSSHVCDYLDVEARLQIEEISNNPTRLDDQLFEIFISRHDSGLHVIAAPRGKFDVCNLNVQALDTLFTMIAARYDYVIVDLPLTWFNWTFHLLSRSDGVLVTGTNTIPGLRQLSETVSAVRSSASGTSQIAVVVNRCRSQLFGGIARRHHVDQVLGREKVFFVREYSDAIQSINTGSPLAMSYPGSKISKEMANISSYCALLGPARGATK